MCAIKKVALHPLNTFFDQIYCINLQRRPDKWAHCDSQFEKYGIKEVQRVKAIDGLNPPVSMWHYYNVPQDCRLKAGEIGLIISNLRILEDALDHGYSNILILEDDVLFSDELNNIDEYFKALPENWDMVYASANHNTHVEFSTPPQEINDKIYKLHNSYSTHFVGIRREMFETIKKQISKFDLPLDVCYSILQKQHAVYCFRSNPPIVTQMVSLSDITNEQADYQWLIK